MRSGAAAGHTGYFHETAFYGSDEELLEVALPFIEDGRSAGEPTLVTLNEGNAAIVRRALGDTEGIDFLPATDQYARPARTIVSYRELLASYLSDGAAQIRVVGDVPHTGTGGDWSAWLRYEAAVNHALDDFPLWGLCPYDTRITPDDVLADVERVHPHIAVGGGHHRNDLFTDPARYVAERLPVPLEPHGDAAPSLVLRDVVSPGVVRRAITAMAAETSLGPDRVEELVFSASEVVTNALRHGEPPVEVRLWLEERAIVCQVHDAGSGPDDPFAGLLPAPAGSEGGYGLWVAHQVCDQVDLRHQNGSFVVRLIVRDHTA